MKSLLLSIALLSCCQLVQSQNQDSILVNQHIEEYNPSKWRMDKADSLEMLELILFSLYTRNKGADIDSIRYRHECMKRLCDIYYLQAKLTDDATEYEIYNLKYNAAIRILEVLNLMIKESKL